jgi:hypothetical protein
MALFGDRGMKGIHEITVSITGNLTREDILKFIRELPPDCTDAQFAFEVAYWINTVFSVLITAEGKVGRRQIHEEIWSESEMIGVNRIDGQTIIIQGKNMDIVPTFSG